MDHDFKTDTIKILIELLIENYVFPETADNLRSELTQRLNDREYEDINDHTLFAELLTSQLQNVSQDKHLQIRHSTEKPQVENTQKDNNVHHDNFLTMVRLDNYGFNKIERLPGNIGFLEFQAFMPPEHAGETVSSAMTFLANTSCMIIDLRNNFGGSPNMVAFLSSYLLEPSPTHLNNLYWRKSDETQQFWSLPYVPGKRFGGTKPL
ncbi:S41 family peptidase [Paenibacillus prosopidis]|uniref:Peptidase S41-like protein n=1 Tax=Paenibacillus prosopidis TaxID=630520 RepID=A0A368W189_9BACL|nr:peptidase S41-like protein [Paenibacillus prosopidis]